MAESVISESGHAYVCPRCLTALQPKPGILQCTACLREYPSQDGIVDFTEGQHYDSFDPGQQLSERERAGLEGEFVGAEARAAFYMKRLRQLPDLWRDGEFRVLDCGCGNGISVDLFNKAGIPTWGNDSSSLRKWQWEHREWHNRLLVSDARRLPFRTGFFSAILCSGLLEHIGVVERGIPKYSVEVSPGCAAARIEFLRELFRVLDPAGILWLDSPNGAFPIDFWHAGSSGFRIHSPLEGFLPRVDEIEGYLRELEVDARVEALSPKGRLRFRQVRKHWYGRLFSKWFRLYFRILSHPLGKRLRRSWLNPYLVVEIQGKPGIRNRAA